MISAVMDTLPDELLLQIFSNLSVSDLISGVRLVSWRWYHLSKDAALWTDVDLSDIPTHDNEEDLRKIQQGVRNLLHNIQNSLQCLTFGATTLDGGTYELFGSAWRRKNKAKFPALRYLDYSFSYASPRNLRVAITTHPDIEELILCHTRLTLCDAIKEVLHLPNLKVFVFKDSSWHLDQDLNISKLHLMKVPKMCRKLEIIELHTIQTDLDDDVIQQFLKNCPKLQRMSLICSSSISSEAFSSDSPNNITELELLDRQKTQPFLDFVLPWFPLLTHLAVNGQYVSLEDCNAIRDCCPNLQELIFEAKSFKSGSTGGLFGSYLSRDNEYSLCGLELITIAEGCKLLKKLHAPNSNIDDESVNFLTEHCPHLEDINFSKCRRLTKLSLIALSKNCLKLKLLHFQECFVKHEHLMCVLLQCRQLYEVFFDRKSSVQMVSAPSVSQKASLPRDVSNASLSNIDDIPYIDMMASSEDNELRQMLMCKSYTASECHEHIQDNIYTDLQFDHDLSSNSGKSSAFHNHSPLKRLSLKQSDAEEKFLMAFVRECPSLTLLCLEGTEALTDNLVVTIAQSCPNLELLGLCLDVKQTSHSKFGDAGLLAVINMCKKLECLSFLNNRNVTSAAVQMLFQSLETTLHNLKTVSLCVGRGYACSPTVIALYGLKFLTENSKQKIKSATTKNNDSFLFHLDFKKRKI